MVAATPDGPRLAPLAPKQWPAEMRGALAALRPAHPRHPLPRQDDERPKGLNVARHVRPASRVDAGLPHVHRAHTVHVDAHAPPARAPRAPRRRPYGRRRTSGSSMRCSPATRGWAPTKIDRIAEGAGAPGWSPLGAAMLRAVDELVGDAKVADDDVGRAGQRTRRPAVHGPRLHRRRLRRPGHGVPVVRGRTRRGSSAEMKFSL